MSTKRKTIDQLDYLRYLRVNTLEEKHNKTFFFDAFDQVRMIQGYESLFGQPDSDSSPLETGSFKLDFFNSERFFVQTLAVANQLKSSINSLPPHQKEFYLILKQRLERPNIQLRKGNHLKYLVKNINLGKGKEGLPSVEINQYSANELGLKLKQIREVSIPAFKILFSVFKPEPKERVRYLFRNTNILNIWKNKFDYAEILQSIVYQKLLDSVNNERPSGIDKQNNFNDAMALAILLILVRRFNNGEDNNIPVFFDSNSQSFFSRVISGAGLSEDYKVNLDGNHRHSVLRDEKYFILHSILNQKEKGISHNLEESLKEDLPEVERFVERFSELEKVGDVYSFMELNLDIESYVKLKFLKKVMMKVYSDSDYENHFKEMDIQTGFVKSKTFKQRLDKDLSSLDSELAQSIEEIKKVQNLWPKIKAGAHYFNTLFDKKGQFSGEIDLERDMGLMRFSLSRSCIKQLKSIFCFDAGILSEDDGIKNEAQITLLSKVIAGITDKNSAGAEFAFSSLWLMGQYRAIIEMEWNSSQEEYSIDLIKGASLLKEGRGNSKEIVEVIQKLKKYKTWNDFGPHVGMAYLYYHLWKRGSTPFTEKSANPKSSFNNDYNIKALSSSLLAYEGLSSYNNISPESELLRLYSLNQYVYYLTESADDIDFYDQKNQDIANSFPLNKTEYSQFWHFRFDDTIARFFHRKAFQDIEKPNQEFLDMAKVYSNKACRSPFADEEVNLYSLHLTGILISLR